MTVSLTGWTRSAGSTARGFSAARQTFEELLLQFRLGDLDLDGLVHLLGMSAFVVGVVLDGGREEGVDKRRLSQARLASDLRGSQSACFMGWGTVYSDHDGEGSASLCDNFVSLVGQVGNANGRCRFRRSWGHIHGGTEYHRWTDGPTIDTRAVLQSMGGK